MAGFCQFLKIFLWNSLILGLCILGGGWEEHGDGLGGGKILNKEERRHK